MRERGAPTRVGPVDAILGPKPGLIALEHELGFGIKFFACTRAAAQVCQMHVSKTWARALGRGGCVSNRVSTRTLAPGRGLAY